MVLAAIDDTPAAIAVARGAGDAALALGGEVVAFTAVGVLPDFRSLAGLGWIDEPQSVADDAEATLGRVGPVLDRLGVAHRTLVGSYVLRGGRRSRVGQIARAVRRAAAGEGAGLVVVGHTPHRRPARSSVAARLLRGAAPDVLVVPTPTPPSECPARRAS